MTTYILIFAFWAGALSDGDSVSLTNIEFSSKEKCEIAGKTAQGKFKTLMKSANFVCVEK